MARVTRLAGALLVASENAWYLVGNTKEPCDWEAAGFVPPAEELDAVRRPVLPLMPCGDPQISGECLPLPLEGEPLAQLLAQRMLIRRNGSVSERLWQLVLAPEQIRPAWGQEELAPATEAAENAQLGRLGGGRRGGSLPSGGVVGEVQLRWFVELPSSIWEIVRDSVLRCL